ncbi:hypothetical protein KUTeg_004568 [Tegillarca granosa]|uniref:Ubiquitin-like protein ATG12 n=1 Tax=Tegillarca granosa TaxID=220873 RepID=A0ABQ9FQB4_TEGGR|nr:hypothetical protein KUTeg_004568 [Tegillarca granosa]
MIVEEVMADDTRDVSDDTVRETKEEEHTAESQQPSTHTEVKSTSKDQSYKTGDAPILKKKKWAVERNKQISWICAFIKKYIRCDPTDSLFLYVNQSFSPSPDTEIGSVFDCFGSDGKLVLHYCKSQAWG